MCVRSTGHGIVHELTLDADLDASAPTSRGASTGGFHDGLAGYRRAAGWPAVSVAWGPGDEFAAEQGAALLAAVRGWDEALVVAEPGTAGANGDVPARRHLWAAREPEGLPADRAAVSGRRERLARLPEADRQTALLGMVRTSAAAVLGHASAEAIEPDRSFRDLGFDSLTAVELRDRLNHAPGCGCPPPWCSTTPRRPRRPPHAG